MILAVASNRDPVVLCRCGVTDRASQFGCPVFVTAVLASVVALTGCGANDVGPTPQHIEGDVPNIVLITIGSLRADNLSCYGYGRTTSPFLDALARNGIRFSNAYSTSSWVASSMASIFTGLYPRSHGVLHGRVEGLSNIVKQEVLSKELLKLPQVLSDAGYTTIGVSTNGHLARETGFADGFDEFELLWFSPLPAPNRKILKLVGRWAGSGPLFLWIHYVDLHPPHQIRQPWISRYASHLDICEKLEGVRMKTLQGRIDDIKRSEEALPALIDLYDSEINYCDQRIEKLFERLSLGDNTIVVVTSDHGEEFLEHDWIGHGKTLFEEVVSVPLIINLPFGRGAGVVVDHPVSNREVFRTIVDAAGIDIPSEVPGESLLRWLGPTEANPSPVFFELDRGWIARAVRSDRWKLICKGKRLDQCSLYDLEIDPGELMPRESDLPEQAEALGWQLIRWMDETPAYDAPETEQWLTDEEEEKLRTLGYLE